MTVEKELVMLCNAEMKKAKGLCITLSAQHISGLPDKLLLFKRGQFVFVELKSKNKKPSKIQKYMHVKLKGLGFRIEVISDKKDLLNLIKELNT